MYHLFKEVFSFITCKEEYTILLLGLGNSGKTRFLEQIKALYGSLPKPTSETLPTSESVIQHIPYSGIILRFIDFASRVNVHDSWSRAYTSCHAIVFIIDSADVGCANLDSLNTFSPLKDQPPETLRACKTTLEHVLHHPDTEGLPILILANKQDRENCIDAVQIKEILVKPVLQNRSVIGFRDLRVLPFSALTGVGVKPALEWLCTRVKWNRTSRPAVRR